jgi:hypothetical protein
MLYSNIILTTRPVDLFMYWMFYCFLIPGSSSNQNTAQRWWNDSSLLGSFTCYQSIIIRLCVRGAVVAGRQGWLPWHGGGFALAVSQSRVAMVASPLTCYAGQHVLANLYLYHVQRPVPCRLVGNVGVQTEHPWFRLGSGNSLVIVPWSMQWKQRQHQCSLFLLTLISTTLKCLHTVLTKIQKINWNKPELVICILPRWANIWQMNKEPMFENV